MQLDEQRPLLTLPGEGEIVTDRPERTLRILGELDELIVTWFRYEPGQKGPDAHIHEHHTDAFYVLEGELELSLGPELTTFEAGPGTFAGAPPRRRAHLPQRERRDGRLPQLPRPVVGLRRPHPRAQPVLRPARPAARRWPAARRRHLHPA